MADDKTITEDDEIEIVEVETLPKPGETPKVEDKSEDEDDEEDKPDEEDARLVADDDDDEADATDAGTPAHKKRVKRRQIQKQARDRTLAEVATLRESNAALERRLASLETNQVTQTESQIDDRLAKTREDIGIADRIMAKAMEAGNGEDFIAAQSMRDAAKDTERELLRNKGTVTKVREGAPDPKVVELSSNWKAANSGWYGSDANATTVANRVDSQVAADGYNPATPAYWQELSRRLQAEFQPPATDKTNGPKKKTPPPQGQTREHVPQSTRSEVYVTPERKEAMKLANKWDDKVERDKMLRYYKNFDREESERNR